MDTYCISGSKLTTCVILICYLLMETQHCVASPKKVSCLVKEGTADCSHLSLSTIPTDLPRNITSLDMSHNRMAGIPPESLIQYSGLLHLNMGYNSITKLNERWCVVLPHLQTLNMVHNEVHQLKDTDLSNCTSLTWLSLASNRLKIKGEPFSALKNLKFLDVSNNKLQSAKLGSQPQMPSLSNLNLAFNMLTTLKEEDFSFLRLSPFLQVLNLSFVPLKNLEPGCFKPITGLRVVFMDGSTIDSPVISQLCSELGETSVNSLSLRNLKMVTLKNTTLSGLQKTNLTFLDLSQNDLTKVEDGSFQWLSKLEILNLSDNRFKHLTKFTFLGLKSLKKLQMTKALVKSRTMPILDDFTFQPLGALESLILQRTAVWEISEHTFTGLGNLQELDMSWGTYASLRIITNKTFVSLAGSPLRTLNLTGTAITRINPRGFSFFRNLTILLLDFNFIQQTFTGSEFEGLTQVQEIHLTNNHWKVKLSSTSFLHVPNLRVLTLGKSLNNSAVNLDVDPSPFKPLLNLTILDLSNNNIANFRANLLEGLINLQVLKLQHNNLARLWKSANPGGPVLFLKGAQNLVNLQLDNNGLDEIPHGALKDLRNLKELYLANNLLNSLQDSIFDNLEALQVLSLGKNLITAVKPEVFKVPTSNLSVLSMDKNPFDCTCESILWFVTWLNETNRTTVPGLNDQYKCNTPLAYFNHSISTFDTYSCKDMVPFQALHIFSSMAVLMLMVTAFLVRFQGWRIQFYWNILISRTLGFKNRDVSREFGYDAYIIHAEEDTHWVEKIIVPLENKNCNFYLESRDAIPGMPQLQNIVDNMRDSRKILFVVSEHLLNNPLCRRFTAHHALHQVIEESRDAVILVFLQDVHDFKLSSSLFLRRGMLHSCCILEWPGHKEKLQAFHQKLLIALGLTNQL